MSDLAEREITSTYNKIKASAGKSFAKGDYDKCLDQIELSANIAYNFNYIYKDDYLEDLLASLSGKMFGKSTDATVISGRFVFYDYFGMANRGLTQQYIKALIALDLEFMYVLENYSLKAEMILDEIKSYDKAQIVIVEPSLSLLEKIKYVYKSVLAYRPEKAFLHLHPASVVAVTVWNALSHVERYQINLTDHAFWLGVGCIDFSLEFRDYGCTVSFEQRGIPKEKLLLQPFYPITDCDEFKGLPEIDKDQVMLFTGGAYYKMYGADNAFFIMLKRLLDENPKAVIMLAGYGDANHIKNFIEGDHYESRIFFLGSRTDINYVFQHCDIYLCTYPITGGLMCQYAALNGKPILSYSDANIPSNDADSFLTFGENSTKITYHRPDDYFEHAKKLISNKAYREEVGEMSRKRVIDVKSFNELLFRNLYHKESATPIKMVKIDYDRFSSLYLEVENNYMFSYRMLLVREFKLMALIYFTKEMLHFKFIKAALQTVKNKLIHIFVKP